MISEKMACRWKIYKLSTGGDMDMRSVAQKVCYHEMRILSINGDGRWKTCVFCGKSEKLLGIEEPNQFIDATVLGNHFMPMSVNVLREQIMKKLCCDETITVREFSSALKVSKKYLESHFSAGLYEYFGRILPPKKFLLLANDSGAEESRRTYDFLSNVCFRVTNDYGENINMDDCDALVVINPDAVIDEKLYPSYISDDMDFCIRCAIHKSKKVFFTHPLPDGAYKGIRKPLLVPDCFFLHNIMAKR